MSWRDQYDAKLCSANEAVSVVESGQQLYMSGNAATPFTLVDALAARGDELEDVEVIHLLMFSKGESDPLSQPEMEGSFRHNSLFVGPADREAIATGRADYTPIYLFEIPDLLRSELSIDVAMIHTSPPDDHGFLSLGVECLASQAAVQSADLIIAQVNERMPRTLGNSFVHVSHVDRVVEVSDALPELKLDEPGPMEAKIGEHIASLVGDGATLQLGIGGIPDAVLKQLSDRRDLGVHTEMVSDGVVDLLEAGVITGQAKSLHPGKVIATFLLGTERLYDYAHNNPIFEIHPTDYTNDPFVIAQNTDMVAVNSAIEVDLTGQVCSDSIGTKIYSGFGGQVDFIRGAARAPGGVPVIAVPSTAKGGEVSRIVPYLKQGAGVVTTRAAVHYVVTEYGIAQLWGKTLRERAEALIEIAHPDFREELERAYMDRFGHAPSRM